MFSERLKELRVSKNLTQREVALQLELATTTYSMYEQGRREPDIETIQKIAIFYGVSADYLLGITIVDEPPERSEIVRSFESLSQEDKKYIIDLIKRMKR